LFLIEFLLEVELNLDRIHCCYCHLLFDLLFSKLILRILLLGVWGRLLQYKSVVQNCSSFGSTTLFKIDWWLAT
jgi:hypothetical protein